MLPSHLTSPSQLPQLPTPNKHKKRRVQQERKPKATKRKPSWRIRYGLIVVFSVHLGLYCACLFVCPATFVLPLDLPRFFFLLVVKRLKQGKRYRNIRRGEKKKDLRTWRFIFPCHLRLCTWLDSPFSPFP